MKKISRYILKYWYLYAFALFCLTSSVALDMLSPQVTKSIIDDVIGDGKTELLLRLLLFILIIGVGRAVFQYLKELTFDLASSRISVHIRQDLFRHIQSLSLNYFDKTNTGELMARIKDDVDSLWNGLGYVGMLMIEIIIHTGLVMYCMISLSPKLAVLPIAAMPIVAGLAFLLEKKLDNVYSDISEENAKLNTVAQENLAGVRTVKAFAREKFEISKFLSHNKRYYDLNMKQSKVLIRYQPVFQLVTKLLPIITILLGGRMVIKGEITLGTLGAFISYCNYIVWPMETLGWVGNECAAAIASYKKIKKIYNEKPMIESPVEPVVLPEVSGAVTFDHVSFSLGGKDILKDVSFTLPAGKTLGIMGATGSGKTSILNLLGRFYDPDKGTITLDHVNIKDLSLSQLRGSMAPVMQDVFLFSDTVSENVKFGKRTLVGDELVNSSLKQAQAMEFVSRLEDGTDTLIGERGVGLSGGQKQRISIARALAKKAPILILDDSTSALDMETELAIQKELNELNSVTKIIIAHRISAVRHADEILFLADGTVAEHGTHEELMAKKGLYYDTFMAQYGEFIDKVMPAAAASV
ncbi:MAG: ABC transporter ATP-binding protein [Lachnospiraceae bacterium]